MNKHEFLLRKGDRFRGVFLIINGSLDEMYFEKESDVFFSFVDPNYLQVPKIPIEEEVVNPRLKVYKRKMGAVLGISAFFVGNNQYNTRYFSIFFKIFFSSIIHFQ